MRNPTLTKLIERSKRALGYLPFVFPVLVLAISLGSSLLVADPIPARLADAPGDGSGLYGGGTDELTATVNEAQDSEFTTADSIRTNIGRNTRNYPPTLTPPSDTYTPPSSANRGVLKTFIIPVSDPESNPITGSIVSAPGPKGATVVVRFDGLNWVLDYTSQPPYLGVEPIKVRFTDSPPPENGPGLTTTITVLVTVVP